MTAVRAIVDGKVVTFEDKAQYDAWLHEETRRRYPERFAPNGELLCNYPGSSWDERLVAWQFAHEMAGVHASLEEEPEIPASTGEDAVQHSSEHEDVRDADQPYWARAR